MILKQIPEDFIVEEVINLKLSKSPAHYLIYELNKTNWDSFKIINALSKAIGIKSKFIGFAGNKDKLAVTKQFISFYKIDRSRVDSAYIHDVRLRFVGYSHERINLGDLEGNNFKITVRKLKKRPEVPNKLFLENYFDDQRFGSKKNTHLVGKAIIKRDFKKACELLGLKVDNNDYVGILRTQQRRLLRFYISAYQSFIFNNILSKYIQGLDGFYKLKYSLGDLAFVSSEIKNFKIPLVSFDSEFPEQVKEISNEILKDEEIKLTDFIFREMPELVSETSYRDAFLEVKGIKAQFSPDELNKEFNKTVISFFLPKGVYATMLIKKLERYLS